MAKYTLDVNDGFDLALIGVVTPVKYYKLAWLINNELGVNLERVDDLVVDIAKSRTNVHFPCYLNKLPDDYLALKLMANKSNSQCLMPDFKEIDYFFIINGKAEFYNLANYIKGINQIELVVTAFQIDVEKISAIHRLIPE